MDDRSDHPEERARVRGQIGPIVEAFFLGHDSGVYHASDLAEYVGAACHRFIANESATRIMRDLRDDGRIDYICISRSESLYVMLGVNGTRFDR